MTTTPFHTILERVDAAKEHLPDYNYKEIVDAVAAARNTTKRYVRMHYVFVQVEAKPHTTAEEEATAVIFTKTQRHRAIWEIIDNEGAQPPLYMFSHLNSIVGSEMLNFIKREIHSCGSYIRHVRHNRLIIIKCEDVV